MTWFVVHMGTGTVFDMRDGVRFIDWDSLPEQARELLDSGHDSDAVHVAGVYGIGVDVVTDSGFLELRTDDQSKCDACERWVREALVRFGSYDICEDCHDTDCITEMLAE